MLINARDICFQFPQQEPVFQHINFSLQAGEKAAIVGHNGAGKSTLLRIIAGQLSATAGELQIKDSLYYVPQHYGHYQDHTVAAALGIDHLLTAVDAVEAGDTSQHLYDLLEHDWDIRSRVAAALANWGLAGLDLQAPMSALSGGMKTRLFLSGIDLFTPAIVLLDEPTNHLDRDGRALLYKWLSRTNAAVLLTSHDRQLLDACDPIWELGAEGIRVYGGNYAFYASMKAAETSAAAHDLAHHERALKEAKQKQQLALERKQRSDARAERLGKEGGIPRILLGGRRMAAEVSTGKLKATHGDKIAGLRSQLEDAAALVEIERIMKGHFDAPTLPVGKVLVEAEGINFGYPGGELLWVEPRTVLLRAGDRIAITGSNGSGKSTLFGIMRGALPPTVGSIRLTPVRSLLLDQDYQLIDRSKTVLEQAMDYNERTLEPAWVHTLLANFLFYPAQWHQSCASLSGGEMLRLALCCMVLQSKAPDVIFLDEPTNNLDLVNITMLEQIFAAYKGTLVVVSHDARFLERMRVSSEINM
ncbi:ABC-F family ATP-binding cassette domain-containing protein [Paraflavitalea pollutisoli]|uniref:ABC-F family ATP-binding cassette domain-containing protein n=1 Tax=Paraflavitalea pollutisoli TaxID=3034143 RepID=UPI0023EBB894|nr:ABC-F family ATP-binding cassette domain-containing protein [Paraflavitalea sp. H1-2-19X]